MAAENSQFTTPGLAYAIHEALQSEGVPSDLIVGHDQRPLAVKIPGLLDGPFLAETIPRVTQVDFTEDYKPQKIQTKYSEVNGDSRFNGVLPIGLYSGERMPDTIMRAADIMMRAYTSQSDVLANNLHVYDDGHLRNDVPRHFDNPQNPFKKYQAKQPGLNLHLAFSGERYIEFGLLDDKEALQKAQRIMETEDDPRDKDIMATIDLKLAKLYRAACSSWARAEQHPGDGLVFQGESRAATGRFPIVHLFSSEIRAHAFGLLKPSYGPDTEVLTARQQVLAALQD